jgi:hypothetical protein
MLLESLSLALEFEPAEHWDMKARLVKFGEIEVEGKRYTHDVVIDGGKVRISILNSPGRPCGN